MSQHVNICKNNKFVRKPLLREMSLSIGECYTITLTEYYYQYLIFLINEDTAWKREKKKRFKMKMTNIQVLIK